MFLRKLAIGFVLTSATLGGVATAQQSPGIGPVEEGYVAYHYNQAMEPRVLLAVSGLNCDGTYYHNPLIEGAHIEYVYFAC